MWKVVAADDEGYIREALKKLINWEKMNCDLVSVLEDGQELIQCIENESPDIVITDIQMPGVNGLEVCKYLYETRPETQVIILTAYSDFDYAKNLRFSEGAVERALEAIRNGACIVTDTQMAKAGINKRALARYGGEAYCFMSDEDVAAMAKKNGTTRATASMDKAAEMDEKLIFAIGNAPTALVRLYELIEEGKISPELIIGVPVGFVNVVQSKELIMHADVPYIVAKGRKGGSNIAACIVNALLYMIDNKRD